MDTDGGRWTVFQRRMDGSENFFRPWSHYKAGFGKVTGEYWLGLENIFFLTMRKKNELRVDMESWDGERTSATYSSFVIDSERSGYQLHLGSFSGGMAEDSFSSHNSMKFTTYDKDQDAWDKNCAQHYLGGFWYNACHSVNLNGMYVPLGAIPYSNVQITWSRKMPKTVSMKIRSTQCACNA